MEHFPRVQKLLNSGAFVADHHAESLDLSDPIVPALEYFLSLERVDGFSGKLQELKTKPVGTAGRNDRRVQWASLCAELGAICLLGKTLKIPLLGFDKPSPRATRPGSNCDMAASVNGHLAFVEVKRDASEDKQMLPELLEERLEKLGVELGLNITPELLDRNYDCSDIEEKCAAIKRHVESFRRLPKTCHLSQCLSPLSLEAFKVFLGKGDIPMQFDWPPSPNDLKAKLIGPGGRGRDGQPMKPMVEQAAEKGADYLCFRVSREDEDEWREIVGGIFSIERYGNDNTYFTSDRRLQGLCGIALFARYDDFCIINNLNVRSGMWLRV